jgi:putative peptide zinc metalloprotease protein
MEGYNIALRLQGDGYMVENAGTYFKIGKREGRILERAVNGENSNTIIQEEGITGEQFDQLFKALEKEGVIGAPVKTRKNILFYKIPLFHADQMFCKVTEVIRRNAALLKILFAVINVLTVFGLALMIKNGGDIFSLGSFKMSIAEYVLLYLIFFLSVCLHEFAHGTVCRYLGGKVGTVGLMLIFFSPAMYCDISGIRMVEDRRKQMLASSAGIYVNTVLMAFSSIAFAYSKQPFFAVYVVLSFTTIISNLIPVLRLDGYWILSFATGITNLYKKSLKGVGKLFAKCSGQERFIAVYGLITYTMMFLALGSVGITVLGAVKFLVNLVI